MATKLQNNRVYQIDLDLIDPNPWQPRLTTDPADIEDLAQNIDELGLLQEPLLRPSGDRYQSAFGHRRIEAVRLLVSRGKWNRKGLPARLQEMSDRDMAYVALSENTKRRDISPLEVIKAWHEGGGRFHPKPPGRRGLGPHRCPESPRVAREGQARHGSKALVPAGTARGPGVEGASPIAASYGQVGRAYSPTTG